MTLAPTKPPRKPRPPSENTPTFNALAVLVLTNLCNVHAFRDDELRLRVAQFCAFLAEYDEPEALALIDLMQLCRSYRVRPAAELIAVGLRLGAIADINPKPKAELPL